VSTSAVNMWHALNIWTENVTEVSNEFLPLTQVPPMKQMKIYVLNLKNHKSHVPIGSLTLKLIRKVFHIMKDSDLFLKGVRFYFVFLGLVIFVFPNTSLTCIPSFSRLLYSI